MWADTRGTAQGKKELVFAQWRERRTYCCAVAVTEPLRVLISFAAIVSAACAAPFHAAGGGAGECGVRQVGNEVKWQAVDPTATLKRAPVQGCYAACWALAAGAPRCPPAASW